MNDTTKMILQKSKREKRDFQNEPIRGEPEISLVYSYKNLVRLIDGH